MVKPRPDTRPSSIATSGTGAQLKLRSLSDGSRSMRSTLGDSHVKSTVRSSLCCTPTLLQCKNAWVIHMRSGEFGWLTHDVHKTAARPQFQVSSRAKRYTIDMRMVSLPSIRPDFGSGAHSVAT